MVDYAKHKAHLLEAIARKKHPVHETQEDKPQCKHNWKRFKQRIRPDNPAFNREHGEAYFIVMGCTITECHEKRITDLVIG